MGDDVDDFAERHRLSSAAREELATLIRTAGTLIPDSTNATDTVMFVDPTDEVIGAEETSDRGDRYEDLGLLGVGGMSEVRRVRDTQLRRVLAMKIAGEGTARSPAAIARFVDEAQTTAQLDHPGVVPVHELGRTEDGRLFFTMKEVRGRTLREVIEDVHRLSGDPWRGETDDGWTRTRVVGAFQRVCEAVAHAHARGVVHRDLKPDNVMMGAFGEVLVLDWGLARAIGGSDHDEAVTTDRGSESALQTRAGTVAGTPMYMSPEQARGGLHALDPRSDVYALGVVLYEILYGVPPYRGSTIEQILERVATRRLEPPAQDHRAPPELVALWWDCTERDPGRRPADAGTVAIRVRRWQEGAERQDRARRVVSEAKALLPDIAALRRRSSARLGEATRESLGVQPWDPIERKLRGWRLEDEARELASRAELEEIRAIELLRAALTQAPDLAEARSLLADLYRERHREAEDGGDRRAAARYEIQLRAHDDGRYAAWLQGDGRLTLLSDPPGATVELSRYVERERRLEAEPRGILGVTPLVEVALPMGSWLLRLRCPGRRDALYPVRIDRGQHWDGTGADGALAPAIVLLPEDSLGLDDCYVPAGPFRMGGDDQATLAGPLRHVWVDGFVMRRFPVTNTEYIAFLDDLVRQGREAEALRHAPMEPRPGGALGEPVYGRTPEGGFRLQADAQGDRWGEDWPVLLVDFAGASAYAEWLAARTGEPWRLPSEAEWEKAARGVDGRLYPWGDFADATWACCRASRPSRPLPAPVSAFPTDTSPFGVRGLAGNASTWCADRFDASSEDRMLRGGGWSYSVMMCRVATRARAEPTRRSQTNGFRVVRST